MDEGKREKDGRLTDTETKISSASDSFSLDLEPRRTHGGDGGVRGVRRSGAKGVTALRGVPSKEGPPIPDPHSLSPVGTGGRTHRHLHGVPGYTPGADRTRPSAVRKHVGRDVSYSPYNPSGEPGTQGSRYVDGPVQ